MPRKHTHKTDDKSAPLCGAELKADSKATIVPRADMSWDDDDCCDNCLRGIRAERKGKARKAAVAERNYGKRTKTARTHLEIAIRALEAMAEAGDKGAAEAAKDAKKAAKAIGPTKFAK